MNNLEGMEGTMYFIVQLTISHFVLDFQYCDQFTKFDDEEPQCHSKPDTVVG